MFSEGLAAGLKMREYADKRAQDEEMKKALADISNAKPMAPVEDRAGVPVDGAQPPVDALPDAQGAAAPTAPMPDAQGTQSVQGIPLQTGQVLQAQGAPVQVDPQSAAAMVPGASLDAVNGRAVAQAGLPAPAAPSGKWEFLGKQYDKPLSDSEISDARTLAMAGVLKKYNPIEGMRLEQSVKQGQRDDKRFGFEVARDQREQDLAKKEDDYRAGRSAIFNGTHFAQNKAQYDQQMQAYTQAKSEYDQKRASGITGPELGLAPAMPEAPAYTAAHMLADRASVAAYDAQHGKLDAKGFADLQEASKKLQDEGLERSLHLAQGGAPIDEIAKAYNATGQDRMDPAKVISDKMVPGPDGLPTRVIQYKDDKGEVHTYNSLAQLRMIGKAKDDIDIALKLAADKRADKRLDLERQRVGIEGGSASVRNELGRAQIEEIKTKTEDRKDLAAIHGELNAAIDAGDAKAEKAARSKLTGFLSSGRGTASMSPEERRAQFYLASGAVRTPEEAANKAHEKVQPSAADDYREASKASAGIFPSEAQIDKTMTQIHGVNWKAKMPGAKDAAGPPVGTKKNGFEFVGGDPNNKANWRPVSAGKAN